MRIVLLNHGYTGGGAERCVRELHQGLTQRGHDVQVWVANHQPGLPPGVRPITQPWERKLLPLDMLAHLTDWRHRGSIAALKTITPDTCDLLHVHSVSGGWMSIKALQQACSRVPSVWTHHDHWAVSNGFIYDLQDKIPISEALTQTKGVNRLFSRSPYHDNFKNRQMGKLLDRFAPDKPIMVSPSAWLLEIIRHSPRFKHAQARQIPNGLQLLNEPAIDMDRLEAKATWNLAPSRPVVLMIAAHLQDVHKGIVRGLKAFMKIRNDTHAQLLLLGRNISQLKQHLPPNDLATAWAADNAALARAYRATDVVVIPSLDDNFPYVALEAMACQTPVCAFHVGGLIEMTGHQLEQSPTTQNNIRGLTARPYDIDQMARQIQMLLSDQQLREAMGNRGRAWVQEYCNIPGYLDQIEQCYRNAISQHTSHTS